MKWRKRKKGRRIYAGMSASHQVCELSCVYVGPEDGTEGNGRHTKPKSSLSHIFQEFFHVFLRKGVIAREDVGPFEDDGAREEDWGPENDRAWKHDV